MVLAKLLSSGIEEGAKKALKKATKDTVKDALSDAVSKTSSKAISKSLRNEITDEVTDAAIKKMPRNLTGAGVSSLEKNAGSTLDGILGRSSGITLRNAKKPVSRNLADEFADTALAKTAKEEIADIAARNSRKISELDDAADISWDIARDLKEGKKVPKWLKDDAGYNKLRSIGENQGIAKGLKDEYSNINDYGIDYSKLTPQERKELWDYMKDDDNYVTPTVVAEDYADEQLEPEGLINPNQARLIDQVVGSPERKIDVDKITTRKKNIKVGRPEAMVAEAVEETAPAVENPALAEEIASLREKIGAKEPVAAGGMDGGSINTAPTDVAGSEGFNIKLKNGQPTNITVGAGPVGSSKQQRAFRKLDDMTAKSLNANAKQYKGLMEKSGSIGGHYKTVAERARKEAIDQANISQKAQTALALREDIKQQGLQYAERNGVTIDLTGIDNTIGMSATQKRKLAELGLGLDDMLGGSSVVSPTQAEEIYKTLRDYAYNWSDSKDALTKMAGNACEKEANAVRDAIDNAMDNINIDYKTSLLEQAAENGEDPAYLRAIAGKGDFKFSDLRKDQSDWIKINDLAGNKIKAEPTINILGIDTGINNPFTAGGDKIKEKIYERQAYGAGGAGAGAGGGAGTPGGTGVPPTGTEGPINFETVGGQPSKLRGLLAKGKDAGLVGAGVLGGLMLGGNGGGQPTAGGQTLADVLQGNQMQQQQSQLGSMAGEGYGTDPYAGMTVGGYTYNELADGYARALQAGDASAAESIAKLMGIIEDRATATLNRQKYESSLKSSSGNNNSASAVNVLSNLYDLYNNIKGGTGPIAGNITNALNAITGGGYNTEANTYWSVSRGALGKMIKGMGDTGALSEGDQKRALQMIPNITDTREAAEQKFMALYNILSSAAQM